MPAWRPNIDREVWSATSDERARLVALTYQLGEWAGPDADRTPAGTSVDAAIGAYIDRAAQVGRSAGSRAGAVLGSALTVVVLILGLILGAVVR